MRKLPLIDPHQLFHQLFTTVGVDIAPSDVRQYWQHHRHDMKEEWAVQSPASSDHIPCALYGDSAKILDDGTKMIGIFLSMPALWRPRSTRAARWCVFAIEEHKLFSYHTLNAVFKRIVYSCNIMFYGQDAEKPGFVLAGGRKFTITELKGDWLWHKQIFRFWSSWTRVQHVCFRCTAQGRSDNPAEVFYCLEPNPAWTEYDLAGFLAEQITEPCPCGLSMIIKFSR